MKKRVLSMFLCLCILSAMIIVPTNVFAQTTVTRGEWITRLVNTFNMTVEDDSTMPDNYFSDITSDMTCYRDILLAVEFGVIDLDAGEAFEPDKPATREFAAQTLNFCLKFQLDENPEYTYSESGEVSFPDDIQVAINRGWFTLSGKKFLPEQAVTASEADLMLKDAADVLSKDNINETYDSKYEFAENVKIIPQTAAVTIDTDYTVTVTDYDCDISSGDTFVAYSDGIPVALKAVAVDSGDNVTTITATQDGTENVVTSVDSEGVAEFDLENFETEDVETYSITDIETHETKEMQISLQSISYDKKAKKLTATKDVKISGSTSGSITVEVSDLKLYHKENTTSGDYMAYIQGNTSVTKSISFDLGNYLEVPSSITLGYINIGGVGNVSLDIDITLKGGMSANETGIITAGFSYARNDGFRLIKGYKKTAYSFTAEAEVKVGLTLSANIDLVVMSGRIWATVGVKGYFKFKDYTYVDGERPLQCKTIGGFLYANVGASASINYFIDKKSWSKTVDIYTESNSPIRVYYHYEDNQLVDCCTRGKDNNEAYIKYTTHTNSAYFNPSPSYGQGSYTGSDGTTTTLWTYTTDSDGNAMITGYKGSASSLAIPSVVDGYTVTKIGSGAFKGNKKITSITMPDSVTEIERYAFMNCRNLRNVSLSQNLQNLGYRIFDGDYQIKHIYIPASIQNCSWEDNDMYYSKGPFYNSGIITATIDESITKIPNCLFMGCDNLREIVIPNNVTYIGNCVFRGCSSLKSVKLSENLQRIGYRVFDNCYSLNYIRIPATLEICYNEDNTVYYNKGAFSNSGITKADISDDMTQIPYGLFLGCQNLQEISVPESVTEIGACAFQGCYSLRNVSIGENVIKIGYRAFRNCGNLSDITLPMNLEEIGSNAFQNCKKITSITIPASLSSVVADSYYADYTPFSGCSGLLNIYFENGIEKIPSHLFDECYGGYNIVMPNSVKEIGKYAFSSCKMETVNIPYNTTIIGEGAFSECANLLNFEVPKNISELSTKVLKKCINLNEVSIPDTVTSMGESVFSECTNLEKVKLPNTRQNIPANTFYNCKNLKEIVLPETVTAIRNSAFYGCTSLPSINLPEGLQTIESSAFYECKALTDISIPKNVTTIGSNAFYNCDSLQSAVVNSSGEIGSQAFYDCDALTSLTLADSITKIGSSLCYGCDKLTDIKFGKYITEIPDSSFRKCSALQNVTLPRFCKTVAVNAFAEDTKLTELYVPVSVSSIQSNSFSYPKRTTMYGKEGSYAQEYANGRGMLFNSVNKPITTLAYAEKELRLGRYETKFPKLEIMPDFDTDTITFTSDNTNVATVSETGAISAGYNYGTANITAKTASGLSSTIKVNIVKPASSITLNKSTLEISAGKSEKLTATISPSDSTDDIVWSSDNTNIAIVDKDGNITGINKGSATITAKAVYGNKAATCLVTVADSGIQIVEVTGVTLIPNETEITIGKTYKLKANILPENATNKLLTWTSSNENVATVSDGIVTAKALGTATITVKTVSGGFSKDCTVTVIPKVEITSFTCNNMNGYGLISFSAVNVPDSAAVYLSSYDESGKMLSIQTLSLSNGSAQTILPLANIKSLKAFVLKTNTLRPLADAKEIAVK